MIPVSNIDDFDLDGVYIAVSLQWAIFVIYILCKLVGPYFLP